MPTFHADVDGHRIEIWGSYWTGRETVRYDGVLVSSKRSFLFSTPHWFEATEDGRTVLYEVTFLCGMAYGFVVRRNGLIQAGWPANEIQNPCVTKPAAADFSEV